MKHWNISLPRTPALALARQMLEGCLRTYDVPMEDAEDACRIEHVISAESFAAIKKHLHLSRDAE